MQQTTHAEREREPGPPAGLVVAPAGLRAAIVGAIDAIGFRATSRLTKIPHAALARLRDGRHVRRSTLIAASLAFGQPAADRTKP